MNNINAIKIFGHPVRITPTAEMLCSHSPDEDDYIKRLRDNTLTLLIGGVKWDIYATHTGHNPNQIDVRLKSRDRDPNLALSILTTPDGFQFIDRDIMKGFKDYPEAKSAFQEYIDSSAPNKVYGEIPRIRD